MKRITAVLVILAILLPAFASCTFSENQSCGKLMDEITALFDSLPETESRYEPDSESLSPLGEQDACYIYTGEYGTLPEWALLSDYSVRLPDRPQIYEIHILKVKEEPDVGTVSALLTHRADLLAKYFASPEKTGEYDYSTYRADVYVKGNYVFLLATPDNDSVIALIEKKL